MDLGCGDRVCGSKYEDMSLRIGESIRVTQLDNYIYMCINVYAAFLIKKLRNCEPRGVTYMCISKGLPC